MICVAEFGVFSITGCASTERESRREAQRSAVEEDAKGSGEDFPPALQVGQLLRIFGQAVQEQGDGAQRLGGGNRAGMRAGDFDGGRSRMAHPFGDGVQQQRPAGDGFSMPIRLGQTNEDVPLRTSRKITATVPLAVPRRGVAA